LWIGVPEGKNAVRAPGVATLVLLDRRPLQFPPFAEGTGLGRLVLCFLPFSSFRSLALRRKGRIVVGLCWGRAKVVRAPGVATLVLLDRCSMHSPLFARAWGWGRLSSVCASPCKGVRHLCFSFSHAFFLLLPLGLTFVVGGAPIQFCGRFFGNMWK